MDVFIEKIVARKKKSIDLIISIAECFGILIIIGITLIVPVLAALFPFVLIGGIYIGYLLITSKNIEFEYIFTNGEIDIDKIIAQRKRKRIFNSKISDFEILAKYNSDKLNNFSNVKKIIDASSDKTESDTFFGVVQYKGERTMVIFTPDHKILTACKSCIPRKIFY